jgi:5-methylcytosine-specific restriction endonuclease McrA
MNQVIVLNKAWAPVDIIDIFDAVTKLYQEKAWALDSACRMYKWEDWVNNWSEAADLAHDVVKTPSLNIPIPRVIVLRDYKGFVVRKPKCNRRNLFKRDNETCQYCGYHGDFTEFDIEHVIPQSRGGKTVWTNVVLSCKKCNQKKRNRTPEEAGMKLLRKPFKPKWNELKGDTAGKKINSWHELLSEMYWSVELKEV